MARALAERGAKFILRLGRAVGIPIHQVEAVEGKSRLCRKRAGKSAFSAPGTADYHNTFHRVTSLFIIISKGRRNVKNYLPKVDFIRKK
jgi:hypothetical protein